MGYPRPVTPPLDHSCWQAGASTHDEVVGSGCRRGPSLGLPLVYDEQSEIKINSNTHKTHTHTQTQCHRDFRANMETHHNSQQPQPHYDTTRRPHHARHTPATPQRHPSDTRTTRPTHKRAQTGILAGGGGGLQGRALGTSTAPPVKICPTLWTTR